MADAAAAVEKRRLAIRSPDGTKILRWMAHIVGFRVLKTRAEGRAKTASRLVEMTAEDWSDVHLAAQFANSLATFKPLGEIVLDIQEELHITMDSTTALDTSLPAVGRKGVLFRSGSRVVIAFEATKPREMKMNAWSHAKDSKWSLPYARFLDGRQVHSFFLDMWIGMRNETLEGLSRALESAEKESVSPDKILIAGHSMGGGISTLALIDIVEHVRHAFGSASPCPRSWAEDGNLGRLVKHITFAEFAACGSDYSIHLNQFYEKYQIPAWDFVHPHDFTTRLHLPFFRSWRGHRYVVPDAAVRPFVVEYASGRHDMPGYMKSMGWLDVNQYSVRSIYKYKDS